MPRTDKKKNIDKVTAALVVNPLSTARELAEKTWLWASTANRARQELANQKRYIDLMVDYERKQRIISDDIKETINSKLLSDFVDLCWSRLEATQKLEEYMKISLWMDKRRRSHIWESTRYWILHKNWFKCVACWSKPNIDNDVILHIDHIIPYSLWWIDSENNYQVLCSLCNSSKWNKFIYNHKKDE